MADDLGQDVMNQISKPLRSVYERVTHYFGDPSTPSSLAPKTQQMNWKPTPNEEQKQAIGDKDPETKPLSQRTLGGKKRPEVKKPATNQTQRKQP